MAPVHFKDKRIKHRGFDGLWKLPKLPPSGGEIVVFIYKYLLCERDKMPSIYIILALVTVA